MKRINIMLSVVLFAAIGLFVFYLYSVHNQLDTTGPVITVDQSVLELSVRDPESELLQGIRAVDERDGDVTDSLLVESVYGVNEDNMVVVTYAAFDRSGNVSKIQRNVCYTDYVKPKFQVYRSLTFPAEYKFDLMNYVGAYDVLDGKIDRRVRATLVSDTHSISDVGSHEVQLQVTNDLGDTVQLVLPVEVYDSEWYSGSVTLKSYLLYLNPGDRFVPEHYLESFLVRGEPIDLSYGIPYDVSLEIRGKVDTTKPGVYSVDYILSKDLNMTTFSGIARLVVVVEA